MLITILTLAVVVLTVLCLLLMGDVRELTALMSDTRFRLWRVERRKKKRRADLMRVNVYAEEMTDRIEIIEKVVDGQTFTGVRFYLELPVTTELPTGGMTIHKGPFLHRPGDDDSAAVTFWGKRDLRAVLTKALNLLDAHHFGDGGGTV